MMFQSSCGLGEILHEHTNTRCSIYVIPGESHVQALTWTWTRTGNFIFVLLAMVSLQLKTSVQNVKKSHFYCSDNHRWNTNIFS